MAVASSVCKATPADAPRLALALASAFQDDPVIAWVFPDERHRRAVLPAFMVFRLRKLAFPHDQIWMTGKGAAASVWLPPPGRWQESRWQRLGLLPPLVRFLGLRTPSVLGGLNLMEERHPHDPPHWYLFILGAEQAAQGRGLGSALLTHILARVDADGMPAYLESSNERNLAFMAATALRSPAKSSFRVVQGSGSCGARPAVERLIAGWPFQLGHSRSHGKGESRPCGGPDPASRWRTSRPG
jgi:GNAT superfamily N-acetyltransferase